MHILRSLQVPGVDSFLMPPVCHLGMKKRKIATSQFMAYVSLPLWDLNQAMHITHFEQLLDGVYDFSDRIYEERLRT